MTNLQLTAPIIKAVMETDSGSVCLWLCPDEDDLCNHPQSIKHNPLKLTHFASIWRSPLGSSNSNSASSLSQAWDEGIPILIKLKDQHFTALINLMHSFNQGRRK